MEVRDPKRVVWDAYRFYTFFWLWTSPAYWLISNHLENGAARRDAGLTPPYLFFTLVFLSVLAGCYFLINLKPNHQSDRTDNIADSISSHNDNKGLKIFGLIWGFGALICVTTSWTSGLVVYDLIYPDEPLKQFRFPIEGKNFKALCIMLIGNFGLFSLYQSAKHT